MTHQATQIEVPNFEGTTDPRNIFTPKKWLENTQNKNTKWTYIAELSRGAEMTQNRWSEKEGEIQENFIWGHSIGTETVY